MRRIFIASLLVCIAISMAGMSAVRPTFNAHSNPKSSDEWIRGGSKTFWIGVKADSYDVSPGEEVKLLVIGSLFNPPDRMVGSEATFKLYSSEDVGTPIFEEVVACKRSGLVVSMGPVEWSLTAPESEGVYHYRVVCGIHEDPTYDSYDVMVEFTIRVRA